MASELKDVNWRETFLFFYWDIQRYRPECAEKTDALILDFFYEEEPAAGSNSDPYSWDAALYGLMRIMRCRLGSNIYYPGKKCDYSWLRKYDAKTSQSPPYIDWFWLEPHVSMEARQSATSHVSAILEHLTRIVYRQKHDMDPGGVDFEKAWVGNVFLKEFSNAHKIFGWSVPITVHLNCLLAAGWDRTASINKCAVDGLQYPKAYLASMPASADPRYEFILRETDYGECGSARIRFPSEDISRFSNIQGTWNMRLSNGSQDGLRRLEAAKLHFIGMLYWAQQMALTGQALPLSEFIDKQYEELAAVNEGGDDRDEMKLDRMLWTALRSFGLERVRPNCKSCVVETIG